MSDVALFINGTWRAGSDGLTADVIDPATECNTGEVGLATSRDVQQAIESAHKAFTDWSKVQPAERAGVLRRAASILTARADRAALALTTEQGKPLVEARAELARAIDTLAWHGDEAERVCEPRPVSADADRRSAVFPEAIGVIAAFTPWNYPAVIIARKLGAALGAGCTVVLKAAEETPTIAAEIVAALEAAGLPPGVVNLLFGDPPAISQQVLDSELMRGFSFTGSTAVGKRLATRAGGRLLRTVFELGGHAPVLVLEDADLAAAVQQIVAYKFECTGQSCNAPSRIYVQSRRYAAFVELFVEQVECLRVGDGRAASTDMGPLANMRRVTAMQRLTADARRRNGTIRTGGARCDGPGYFWPPTVVTDLSDRATLCSEEPFGPIIPIWPFDTLDEGIARANDNAFGLAGYVFTESPTTAATVARSLAVGSVGINSLAGVPPDVGIAGVKDSGYGYEGGRGGIEAFMNLKVVRR